MSAITVLSFSFRRGLPLDATTVFDARFLKNPFYDPTLTSFSGLDAAVGAHVESDPLFTPFFSHMTELLLPLLPRYLEEGRPLLTIAIGCTGGQHRSVHVAQKLGEFLRKEGYNVGITHRDMK